MPQFKPRVRKHKALRRAAQEPRTSLDDTNREEILPEHQKESRQKFDAMKAMLRAEQPKMSSKKQKRLDKYITTKLRKEENLEILKKLAGQKVDTSLFRSSKNLGIGKDSKRSALAHALRKQRAGISTPGDEALLYEQVQTPEDTDNQEYDGDNAEPATGSNMLVNSAAAVPMLPSHLPTVTGAGLKRQLQKDADGNPIVNKRIRLNSRVAERHEADHITWEGFSSSPDSEIGSRSDYTSSTTSDSGDDAEESSDDQYTALFSAVEERRFETMKSNNSSTTHSDFKAWAVQQMNEARDFTPSQPMSNIRSLQEIAKVEQIQPREQELDALPPELQTPDNPTQRYAHAVEVDRPPELQESRLKLPIVAEEQKIMEAIHNHSTVVVCGATGSGKTTQVPQFLFEAGYGSPSGPTPGIIGVTQPRRVAAVTVANRVGQELGSASSKVSYQVRFESTVRKETAIKFMTDGILVREIASDFALLKYSAIVIDEAHERSVNTDILIGMMSRIVDLRSEMRKTNPDVKPLKVIIMSATLMVESFTKNEKLFRNGPPPIVQSEGRQYPVTMHFSRRTQRDYMEEMFKKVVRGHRKLPPGAILVFLTGQNEINALSKRLRESLCPEQAQIGGPKVLISARDVPPETEDWEIGEVEHDGSFDSGEEDEKDEESHEFDIGDSESSSSGVKILPLYSQLPTKEQFRVFETQPDNTRLIILATNVAETSITIPGIRYVFDCGRVKEKHYDKNTGVQAFEIGWISKASAAQRAGRAGRTGPGHCYRIYSSAVYERDFSEHTVPEILKTPAEGLVLQLKSMDLQHVVGFPFPTPPDRQDVAKAENLLAHLGALDTEGKITALGRELSLYPLSPRFAKMLCIGHQHNCIYLVVAMVAALAVPDIFVPENLLNLKKPVREEGTLYSNADKIEDTAREELQRKYNKAHHFFSTHDPRSDGIKVLSVLCAYAWTRAQSPNLDSSDFCNSHFLRPKALDEAFRLYQQLLALIGLNRPGSLDPGRIAISPPTKLQLSALKQIAAAGFLDQVAIRADLAPSPPDMPRTPKRPSDVPYFTLFPTHEPRATSGSASTADILDSTAVFIHPSSVLSHGSPNSLPPFLIYSRLQRGTSASIVSSIIPRTRMHPITSVSGAQLASLAAGTPLLVYGKPIGKVKAVEGEGGKREVWVVPSLVGEPGGRAWPLPAVKLLQARKSGEWVTERVMG